MIDNIIKKIKMKDLNMVIDLLFPNFILFNDCVFLESEKAIKKSNINDFYDKTDYESFYNHFHFYPGFLKIPLFLNLH